MLTWIIIVLLLLILIDIVRLHRKIDRLNDHLTPGSPPPTDAEIEKILTSQNSSYEK